MMEEYAALTERELAGETEVLAENLPQKNFLHLKSFKSRSGIEPRLQRWQAGE
jgi:hypothetical protein